MCQRGYLYTRGPIGAQNSPLTEDDGDDDACFQREMADDSTDKGIVRLPDDHVIKRGIRTIRSISDGHSDDDHRPGPASLQEAVELEAKK